MTRYGKCRECAGEISLKKDGTLRAHTNGDRRYTGLPFSSRCVGSGEEPAWLFAEGDGPR